LIVVDSGGTENVLGRGEDHSGNAVEIRDSASRRVIHTLIGHTSGVTCLAFSPDSQRLATASCDRTIKLWDVATGREVFTLRGHTAAVVSMAFSPDGHRIASGGIESTARFWDATPLPDEVLQALEARYQQKFDRLRDLTNATNDFQRTADAQYKLGNNPASI